MSEKISLTLGSFDVLGVNDVEFIKQMRKFAVPKGKVIIIVPDDYAHFKLYGYFPNQPFGLRANNLGYFTDNVYPIGNFHPLDYYLQLTLSKLSDYKITFFADRTKKDFSYRQVLKDHGVPIKFIDYGTTKH